ncbi:MAG: alpha-hydroxy-acid oxidizing protein [Rhodoferax sp.]|nr:alpha-hydroxy-acid oxidizing protein [Rhodoferax sp.]
MTVHVHAVQDYAALARSSLEPAVWEYLADGDNEDNVSALRACRLVPRPLRDMRGGNTRLTLFRQTLAHPVLLAPIAYQRLFHPDGEIASALAASAQGAPFLISSLASQPLEAIAGAANSEGAQGAWFQLYWQGERQRTLRLLKRAMRSGCSAVVFTVDAPVKIARFQLPKEVFAVNLENVEGQDEKDARPAGAGTVFNGWMAQAPTWDDLAWLRQQTPLPLLLKGLLHPDDADSAIAAGCDAIVVSNHGGRVLQGTPPSLHALQAIAKRVGGRIPVLLDSGVRTGRDVFVALAHGASAVLLGRPYVWGLAANGAMGVAHVIRLLRDELEMTMALTGCKHLKDIGLHCTSAIG